MKESLPPFNPAAEAVADAIIVSQAHILLVHRDQKKLLPSGYPQALEKATQDECGDASVFALYYLTKKYPKLFERLAIIGTTTRRNIGAQQIRSFRISEWQKHYFFLARDTAGLWYAASPANYTPTTAEYQKPFVSKDLGQTMGQLADRDGGMWHDASDIAAWTQERPYVEQDPHRYDRFHYSLITYPDTGSTQRMKLIYPRYQVNSANAFPLEQVQAIH